MQAPPVRQGSGSLASSPFAAAASLDGVDNGASAVADADAAAEQAPLEELADVDVGFYEDDANLDPLSALEKYCRSDMPQQRLTYAAGIGAAAESLDASAVSGTVVALLRELLVDVYADVRLTALQQTLPVARQLQAGGSMFQSDLETLWDLVQPLLLDADIENQEAASVVLAELSHILAVNSPVAASQKLVWAVQRLQRLPAELHAEGALASLRLITAVVVPRDGSPLTFASVEDLSVNTFRSMVAYDGSPDVRQAVALLLPRFAHHVPAPVRSSLLPGLIKALAADSHWNVRAEVPQLLISLLAPLSHRLPDATGAADAAAAATAAASADAGEADAGAGACAGDSPSSAGSGSPRRRGAAAAASGVEEFVGSEHVGMLCEVADRLCRDHSSQVKVAALAALGQLLPLLPAAHVAAHKSLLSLFASTAKPPAHLASVRVPAGLCGPRLSGQAAALRQRQQQQRRLRANEARAMELQHELMMQQQEQGQHSSVPGGAAADGAAGSPPLQAGGLANKSSSEGMVHTMAAAGLGDVDASWLLAADEPQQQHEQQPQAQPPPQQQQLQPQKPCAPPGTAAAELPLACAFHLGKVALHGGPDCWPQLKPAYLQLAATAVGGAFEVAAALLLAYPDLAAALGEDANRAVLVPVVLELLHTQLEPLAPVLSVMLFDVVSALPAELRICLLQLLPTLATQTDRELAGDWRARLAVAEQLPAVAGVVSKQQVAFCLWPLLLTLARDPVHAVRAAAALQAGQLLQHLPEQEVPPAASDLQQAAEAAATAAAAADAAATADDAASRPARPAGAAVEGADAAMEAAGRPADEPDGAGAAASPPASPQPAADRAPKRQLSKQDDEALVTVAAAAGVHNPHDNPQPEDEHGHEHEHRQAGAHAGSLLTAKFNWMKRGLVTLHQQFHDGLQQGVGLVKDSPGVQKAMRDMDHQLQWLQQHPHSRALWQFGNKLASGAAGLGGGSDAGDASPLASQLSTRLSLGDLGVHLTSPQLMEAAALDPCRFLPTPAWATLAADLRSLSRGSSSERQVFVLAAGSILAAQRRRPLAQQAAGAAADEAQARAQSSGSAGPADAAQVQEELQLEHLLQELRGLAADPVAGVRCSVAAVAGSLLSDADAGGSSNSSSSASLGSASAATSPSIGSFTSSTAGSSFSSSSSMPSSSSSVPSSSGAGQQAAQVAASQPAAGGAAAGTSSAGLHTAHAGANAGLPPGASAVLQECLQRLQRDACSTVKGVAAQGKEELAAAPQPPAEAPAGEATPMEAD